MKEAIVITGGAGGMGLATAKLLAQTNCHVVITDVDQARLDNAVGELERLGASVTSIQSDITDASSVRRLVDAAVSSVSSAPSGRVRGVVHAAGVSPQMGDAEFIVRVNALGTVLIANAFLSIADEGFSLVNVASIAGHMLPRVLLPTRLFELALEDSSRFCKRLAAKANSGLPRTRPGRAYALSKSFVIWYTARIAERYGAIGARVVSVSPGTFDTSMGRLEEKSGSGELIQFAALKRYGRPEEVAELLAFLGSGKAGYITGTDILIDGGTKSGFGWKAKLGLALTTLKS